MIEQTRYSHTSFSINRDSHPIRFHNLGEYVHSIEISCVFENGQPIYWTSIGFTSDGVSLGKIKLEPMVVEDIYQNSRFEY